MMLHNKVLYLIFVLSVFVLIPVSHVTGEKVKKTKPVIPEHVTKKEMQSMKKKAFLDKHLEKHEERKYTLEVQINEEKKRIENHHSGYAGLSDEEYARSQKRLEKLNKKFDDHVNKDEKEIRKEARKEAGKKQKKMSRKKAVMEKKRKNFQSKEL